MRNRKLQTPLLVIDSCAFREPCGRPAGAPACRNRCGL